MHSSRGTLFACIPIAALMFAASVALGADEVQGGATTTSAQMPNVLQPVTQAQWDRLIELGG